MERHGEDRGKEKGVGITNRGLEQEKPAQDFVMDTVEWMEKDGRRDDLGTLDGLAGRRTDIGRNLDAEIGDDDMLTLTPDEQSGGARMIDSRDAGPDHSHH